MTKFILHGGGESDGSVKHDAFFREIAKNLPKRARVLIVYFALPEEAVASRHPVYQKYFERNSLGKSIELKIASRKNFISELQDCDTVYFRGGDTELLLKKIKKYPNFKEELLKKKIVAGSSAGVHFLCRYGLSSSRELIHRGLDILPYKSYCHVNEKNADRARILDNFSGELLLLREGEFRVI